MAIARMSGTVLRDWIHQGKGAGAVAYGLFLALLAAGAAALLVALGADLHFRFGPITDCLVDPVQC
ncbi:MAG: Flp family type IVb pilin [Firmicutes bacterium]|nr:Flp family type IVb pilin [Bacillota bacterium]